MRAISLFRQTLESRYENTAEAWDALLDPPDGGPGPRLEKFIEACEIIQFPGDPKRLFHTLDWENTGYITLKAFQVLVQGQVNVKDTSDGTASERPNANPVL